MEKKTWASIVFLILFAVFVLYFSTLRTYYKPNEEGARCGCVFDIDDTLTCGDPSNVVRMCKENRCAFGLKTARNMPNALDVPLKEQGFPPNVLKDFVYNPAPTSDNVVPTKVKGLQDFQHKWKIDSPSKILFFDDSLSNIKGANAAGFNGVWCSKTFEPPLRGSASRGSASRGSASRGSASRCGIGFEQEKITENFFTMLCRAPEGLLSG